jgi:hypothetical protein
MKEDTTTIDPTWMELTGGYARDMTMRQWYAGMAMQAFIQDFGIEAAAKFAWEQADAMLKAGEAE